MSDENKQNIIENDGTDDHFQQIQPECCGILPYLDRQDRQSLRDYKYIGGDNGILYKHCWSPLANWLVKGTPRWLAPNMLTIIGFIFTIGPFIWLFVGYGTQFKNMNEIPLWFFWMEFFTYFIARMLDEMDGKQARSIGCCSSLGLILDHGCDGFAMGFSILTFVKLCQTGDSIWTLLTVTTSGWGFYVSTLEHFYVGSHFMGPGNMVTDGSVLVFVLFGSMGIWGNDYWQSYLIESQDFTFSKAFNLVFTVLAIINVFGYSWGSISHSYKKLEPGDVTGHPFNGKMFLIQTFGYVIPLLTTSALLFIGEEPLINRKDVQGEVSPLFVVLCIQNFLLGHLNFALILRHVTKMQWNPLTNRCFIFTNIGAIAIIIASYAIGPKLDIMTCIWVLFGLQLLGICHFIVFAIREMSEALGVPFFTTWDPEKKKEIEQLNGSKVRDSEQEQA